MESGEGMIAYRKANVGDIRPVLDLALSVFIKFHTPDCEQKAISSYFTARFKDESYLNDFESGQNLMFVALDDERIVGMINEHGDDHCISEMAVDGTYHRRGIATELMNLMVCELKLRGIDKITLKALPHGLPFYLKYGFVPTDKKQRSKSGFDFTPMAYEPNEIWDVLDKDGNKTGRFHERGRPMATGDYHLCVHVWKHNGRGEWLIDKRTKKSPYDTCGGKWETTGGAAIAGDDSLSAALRESKEELGLDLDPAKGVLFRRFAREGFYGHTYLMDVWVFEHDCTIEDVRFQERETCEVMWATADKIRELIRNNKFFSDVDLYFDEMVEKWRTNLC
jgi:8-oxo-dGTP pyrophosphatase MutT (NUDIX family)/GNAT superfamily N-acetyltransferase